MRSPASPSGVRGPIHGRLHPSAPSTVALHKHVGPPSRPNSASCSMADAWVYIALCMCEDDEPSPGRAHCGRAVLWRSLSGLLGGANLRGLARQLAHAGFAWRRAHHTSGWCRSRSPESIAQSPWPDHDRSGGAGGRVGLFHRRRRSLEGVRGRNPSRSTMAASSGAISCRPSKVSRAERYISSHRRRARSKNSPSRRPSSMMVRSARACVSIGTAGCVGGWLRSHCAPLSRTAANPGGSGTRGTRITGLHPWGPRRSSAPRTRRCPRAPRGVGHGSGHGW